MPPSGLDHFCNRVPFTRDGSQVRSHEFPGTTPDMLRSAVTLRAHASAGDGRLSVQVALTNSGAGHDVPTGVTIRNLVLVVTPTTKDGTVLPQLDAGSGGGPRVPNWGGAGTAGEGNFAGMPGKGFARVLVDENLVENVLFTEAVSEFDTRIEAGATDTSVYAFQLPKDWARRDVRVTTQLWYRRAFKPLADQRKWTQPLNGNPHGTRGDGTDYDGGLVIAERVNRLTCRGRLTKLSATGSATDGTLAVTATLKLPKGTAIDPARDGARVTAGMADAQSVEVDDAVNGFVADGKTLAYAAGDTGAVASMRLTPAGKRGWAVTLGLRGLSDALLGSKRVALGLESGDVCAQRALRCKRRGDGVRCR